MQDTHLNRIVEALLMWMVLFARHMLICHHHFTWLFFLLKCDFVVTKNYIYNGVESYIKYKGDHCKQASELSLYISCYENQAFTWDTMFS